MKFFFCEKCGKRVTDGDLSAGQARDKKLKGVHCASCAAGVMTMEFEPLSVSQARELVAQSRGEKRAEASATTRDSSTEKKGEGHSEARIRIASRGQRIEATNPTRVRRLLLLATSLLSVLILLATGVILVGKATKPPAPRSKHSAVRSPPPLTQPPSAPSFEAAKTPPAGTPPGAETDLRPTRPERLPEPVETAQPVPPACPPAGPEGGAEPQAPARKPALEPAAVATVSDPPPPQPAATAQDLLPYECVLRRRLDALRPVLEARDMEEARRLAQAMAADPELGPLQEPSAILAGAVECLFRRRTARLEALIRLAGKRVTLPLPDYPRPKEVEVVAVEGGLLKGLVSFRIGEETRWAERAWELEELSEEAWRRILPDPEPETAEEWLARALWAWCEGDRETAEEDAKRAEGLAFAVLFARYLSDETFGNVPPAVREAVPAEAARDVRRPDALANATEVVVDNREARVTGAWEPFSRHTYGAFHGDNYLWTKKEGDGVARATFTPNLPAAGRWTVYIYNITRGMGAPATKVEVRHAKGQTQLCLGQKLGQPSGWVRLGAFEFEAGTAGWVQVHNEGVTTGLMSAADAVKFVKADSETP